MPTVELELLWDFENCVLSTYRVEGVCTESSGPTCEGNQPMQSFVANVTACNVDDVCRRLREKGFNRRIKKIQVYSNPVVYTGTRAPDAWTDVTNDLGECRACCDFLVDETVSDNVFIFFDDVS